MLTRFPVDRKGALTFSHSRKKGHSFSHSGRSAPGGVERRLLSHPGFIKESDPKICDCLPGLGETDRQARSSRSGAGDENRHRFSALESSGLDRADG